MVRNTMSYSLGAAAAATGLNKTSILRAIKTQPGKRRRRAVPRLGGLTTRLWIARADLGAIYSPDGMTIQFDNGTIWQRAPEAPPPPLRRRRGKRGARGDL